MPTQVLTAIRKHGAHGLLGNEMAQQLDLFGVFIEFAFVSLEPAHSPKFPLSSYHRHHLPLTSSLTSPSLQITTSGKLLLSVAERSVSDGVTSFSHETYLCLSGTAARTSISFSRRMSWSICSYSAPKIGASLPSQGRGSEAPSRSPDRRCRRHVREPSTRGGITSRACATGFHLWGVLFYHRSTMMPQSNLGYYRSFVYSRSYRGVEVWPHVQRLLPRRWIYPLLQGGALSSADAVLVVDIITYPLM